MITLLYTANDGEVYRHDAYCLSHLYTWRFFEEDCSYEGIPIDRESLRFITAVPGKMPSQPNKSLIDYELLVKDAFKDHMQSDGFSFNFHPEDSKLYVLFVSSFIRVIDEEGIWFIERFMKHDGHIMERLWATLKETFSWEFTNPLHQVMYDTITRLPSDHHKYFTGENWEFWLTSLELHKQSLLGSDPNPDYEDTMDAFATNFIEEVKCLLKS